MISAIVCGCSLWMKLSSCLASVCLRKSKGVTRRKLRQAADDLVGAVVAQRVLQDVPGVVHAALHDVLLGHRQVVELEQDLLLQVGVDLLEVGDLERDFLDLVLGHQLEQLDR